MLNTKRFSHKNFAYFWQYYGELFSVHENNDQLRTKRYRTGQIFKENSLAAIFLEKILSNDTLTNEFGKGIYGLKSYICRLHKFKDQFYTRSMAVKCVAPMATSIRANGLAGNKKIFIFAVLLLLATLPRSSYEFAFKFGGGGDDENDATITDGTGGRAMRRQLEKKFKFHKIERIYADDEAGDENGEDGSNDEEVSKEDRVRTKSSHHEDEAELQFERVRKAQKPRKKEMGKMPRKEEEEEETSVFDSIFSIFSFGKKEEEVVEKEDASGLNVLIDWIMWFGEKSGRLRLETPPTSQKPTSNDADNWLSYLNRWPFNSLFPFGKSEKTIKMPRQLDREKSKTLRRGSDRDNDEDEEPMSEAHFENLLHSLPGFVVNAKHISADLECRQQLQVFHRQLRAKKLWTLQMLDATGKITSGLLRGNINQFGDFDLCTQVKAVVKVTPDAPMRIRGKYCLAHIEISTDVPELKAPIHLTQGRGLVSSHLGNPNHFLARYSIANWGVCVPTVCPASVVQEMLEMNFSPYNRTGIEFHVEVNDNDCAIRPVKHITKLLKRDQKYSATILLIFIHFTLVTSALMIDYNRWFRAILHRIQQFHKRNESNNNMEENLAEINDQTETAVPETESIDNNEKSNESVVDEQTIDEATDTNSASIKIRQFLLDILMKYSPKRSLLKLFSQERLDLEFPIFHLLKLISTLMLYVCLKFILIGHLPISNRDKLVRFLEQPLSIFFRMPIFYADVLLLLSGFTIAYQLSEEMAEKRFIQLLKRLTTKIFRYLPTMFLVLAFQTWILPNLGTGPLWGNLIGQHSQLCEQQIWRNGFSVQNAIDFEDTCSPMTVQIALQIQLYLLGPLIVWLYYTDADAAFFVYGALHALSVAARYSRTNLEHLSMTMFHGIHVSKFYRSANLLYSSPITRATPYLLGIGAGIVYRTQRGSLDILDNLIPLGWTLSISSLLWCFWSPSSGMNSDFVYRVSDAASYAAWSPLVSGLALCWLIFMFPKGESSMLKILCSTRPILFLSRISYPIHLVTYVVVLQSTASVRETVKFHITDLFNLNEIGAIIFYATIVAFIMDVPAQQIRYILVNRLFAERPLVEESESEEPASEAETNDLKGSGAEAKNDANEPAESIWSSDPEEEERNYIERRRSSLAEEAVKEIVNRTESEEEETEEDIAEEAEVKKRP